MTPEFDKAEAIFNQAMERFKKMEEYMEEMLTQTSKWEKWYAWHPVKDIHGKRHWMKTVYRKYNWAKSTEQPFGAAYDYGTVFDVLKEM